MPSMTALFILAGFCILAGVAGVWRRSDLLLSVALAFAVAAYVVAVQYSDLSRPTHVTIHITEEDTP